MQKLPAGVRRRKTGLLEKRFSVNGRRYSAYGRTLQQLVAQEQKKRNEIHMKTPAKKESITTDQYFETWIEWKKLSVTSAGVIFFLLIR